MHLHIFQDLIFPEKGSFIISRPELKIASSLRSSQ